MSCEAFIRDERIHSLVYVLHIVVKRFFEAQPDWLMMASRIAFGPPNQLDALTQVPTNGTPI